MEPKVLTPRERDVLEAIADFLDKNSFPPSIRDLAKKLGVSAPSTIHEHLKSLAKKGYLIRRRGSRALEIAHNAMETIGGLLQIPILGRVPAGQPNLAVEDVEGYIKLDKNLVKGKDLFALKVKGDSMEPELFGGDIVLVKPTPVANNKDRVVARDVDGDVTLKVLRNNGKEVWLEAVNPRYKPIKGPIEIVGKVVGIFGSYPPRK